MSDVATAQIRIYNKGAEGYLTKEAWGEHDILRNSWPTYQVSTWTRRGGKWPNLELVPEVGCVRPKFFSNPQDQLLADWTLAGGNWALVGPISGYPNDLLWQNLATEDTTWTATTAARLPENPRFELVLGAWKPPDVQNWTTYPPYLIIEVGVGAATGDLFRIYVGPSGETAFQRFFDGDWWTIEAFAWDPASIDGLTYLWWDPLAGGVSISTDFGRTRYAYGCTPDLGLSTVQIDSGKVRISGSGHAAFIALNELHCDDDQLNFVSSPRGTYEHRGGVYVIDVSTWSRLEPRTGITGDDLSGLSMPGTVKYRANFTTDVLSAGSDENPSFIPVHRVPELYAVDIEQAASLTAALDWGNPANYTLLDGVERSCSIEHTPEGGLTTAQQARIELPWDPNVVFSGDYRRRFCRVFLEDWRAAGHVAAFHGEVEDFGHSNEEDGSAKVSLFLVSGYARAERVRQERHWPCLAGMTAAAARATWLNLIGLPAGRGTWTATGRTMPKGSPFEPFGAPREGAPAIELLRRIDEAEQTISWYDATDGQWKNATRQAWNTAGSVTIFYATYDACVTAGASIWQRWISAKVVDEFRGSATRWKAVGRTPAGDYISERATDWGAERTVTASPFQGYPILRLAEGEYFSHGAARLGALSLYASEYRAWRKVKIRTFGWAAAPMPPGWIYLRNHDRIGNTDPIRTVGMRHDWHDGQAFTEWEGVCWIL